MPMYGYKEMNMPFFNKLIKDYGVVFTEAYSTTDQTDPSFTTIFSGRHPLIHGILRHGPDLSERDLKMFMSTNTLLLSEILKRHGYITLAIDFLKRWHKRGYDIYGEPNDLTFLQTPLTKLTEYSIIRRIILGSYVYTPYYKVSVWLSEMYPKASIFIRQDAKSYVIGAIKLLKKIIKEKRKPFLLTIHFWDTHTPFTNIPKSLWKKYLRNNEKVKIDEILSNIKNEQWRNIVRKYHLKNIKYADEVEAMYNGAITYLDSAIRLLIEFLEDEGIFEDTIIFFTADHGDNLIRGNIFQGHGGLYQRVIKIPLIIINLPNRKNIYVKGFVQHTDIVPTIIKLANINMSSHYFDGQSLIELVESGQSLHRVVLTVSSVAKERYGFIDENGRYKLLYSPSLEAAMDKYGGIWFRDTVELYDLKKDPDENINIAYHEPELAKELVIKLKNIVKKLKRIQARLIVRHRVTSRVRRV